MTVELEHMCELMLPGLRAVVQSYFMAERWEEVLATDNEVLVTDNLLVKGYEQYSHCFNAIPPSPSLPIGPGAALAIGAAAAIVKNPEVSRRGLFWFWK